MSTARPLEWRYGLLRSSGTAVGFPSTIWGSNHYAIAIPVFSGETVLRTRLQGFFSFGVQELVPSGPQTLLLWYQNMAVQLGVYANPTASPSAPPPSPDTDLSDGFWIQNELVTPHQISYFNNPGFDTASEVLFKLDSGTSESFGKRGPWAPAGGNIYLSWNFVSSVSFWEFNDTDYFGYMGGVFKLAALIETAP